MSSELQDLIEKGESENLELKGPRSPLDALGRAVCGLLNQQGGNLLWGVTEDGQQPGVANPEQKAGELVSYLMSMINPRPFLAVSPEEGVVVVRVPVGADRPYSFNRQIWVRIGNRTMRAGEERSAKIVEQGARELERWEREPTPGFSIDDCDRNELADARREIAEGVHFGSDVLHEDEDILKHLYLQRNGRLTNAAVVLFASQPRRWSPSIYLRITSYVSDKSGPIANDVVVEAPAVRALREAISIIQQRTGVTSEFKKDLLERVDRPAYALYALREGLVNAITHRSYDTLGGSVRIEIFPEHLTISNPGQLPDGWTIQDLRLGHVSIPFNPDIARVFYLRRLAELLGVGTQRLIKECKNLGARPPKWTVRRGLVALTLFRAPIRAIHEALWGRQAEFLRFLGKRNEFKTADYAEFVGLGERHARRDLTEMEELGVIKRHGKGPATVYRRVQKTGP